MSDYQREIGIVTSTVSFSFIACGCFSKWWLKMKSVIKRVFLYDVLVKFVFVEYEDITGGLYIILWQNFECFVVATHE